MNIGGWEINNNCVFLKVKRSYCDAVAKGEEQHQILRNLYNYYIKNTSGIQKSMAICALVSCLNTISDDAYRSIIIHEFNEFTMSGADTTIMQSMESEEFLKKYEAEKRLFYHIHKEKLSSNIGSYYSDNHNKWSIGDCFWYKNNKAIYGAVICDVIDNRGYYLIALTNQINSTPITLEIVLCSHLYTVSWFPNLYIFPRKWHYIGTISINIQHRYGLNIGKNFIELTNCGNDATWSHKNRTTSPTVEYMSDLL